MKKLLLCIIILFFFGTTQVYASTQALDLNEVLELAEIEKDYDDYKEDKKTSDNIFSSCLKLVITVTKF